MKVTLGLERLLTEKIDLVSGKRVGVIANPASVDSELNHAVRLLLEHPEVNLTAILGPQHGVRGETQDNMIEWEGFEDPLTGVPAYSLYGKTRKPTGDMLANVDTLVFDLQDVGARYYTFIHTMALAMEACRESEKHFLVLDRPNPLGGIQLEGPVLDPRFKSFVGLYPMAIRHGMTIGEIALYLNQEFNLECELSVVEMTGWDRSSYYDELDLPWVPPSPNIPRLETALVYPGLCLLEGTNVSEGRGTTLPFEMSGAPWVDPEELVRQLADLNLPGVAYRPLFFEPTFHKWAGHLLGGVHLYVTDRTTYRPFLTGLALLDAYRKQGGDRFEWKDPPYEYEYELLPFDILCGTDSIRKQLEAGSTLETLEASWQSELHAFEEARRPYLLY